MTPAWYQKMNPRERRLAWIVAGGIFLLINFLVWSKVLGGITNAGMELALQKAARNEQKVYIRERDLWARRDQWLKDNQPTLKSAVEASTLLDQVKEIAGKHNVLIENPAIGAGDSTSDHQSVFSSFETKSPWPPLVRFLFDVQQPKSFVVFESVQLQIDNADPTMMRGKFKIARWFVPSENAPPKRESTDDESLENEPREK